ncbi:amidohydrolase 2 [Novosphingobium sp. Rr 2-17]|uniref:amidohydrolase family protein n=1 Tax=Novosphingobium sp. Rr 2-17 TaxID=555793 RepID=UPI000269ABA7|nr:amidohydrolase family protein [Novosphingobium sp. Rr 2-17]EIZ77834.1 amidohydrolase 2 [Novosphingobium sp. Rr 2-17]
MGLDVTGRYRYPAPDPAWLSLSREPVIEPALPSVDPHHHLWLEHRTPYLVDELLQDVESGHNVIATVFVQAHYGYRIAGPEHLAPAGETEKVAAAAREAHSRGAMADVAAGIVAFADLTLGERVEEVLGAHLEVADGRLRGIRHSVSRDELFPDGIVLRPAPAGLLAQTGYRAGLARIQAHDLVFDAMLYHRQIPELTQLARAMPDLRIVLDHIGCILGVGPYEGKQGENYLQWRQDMAELAQCPNVRVKIGGFGMIVCGARWHEGVAPPSSFDLAQAWRPYVETCIELFGARRCMFESNFPVDKAMYSYVTLWNAFKRLTTSLTPADRTAVFSGTAIDTYGLRPQAHQEPAHG